MLNAGGLDAAGHRISPLGACSWVEGAMHRASQLYSMCMRHVGYQAQHVAEGLIPEDCAQPLNNWNACAAHAERCCRKGRCCAARK
jgi:hypothetical protein